MNRAADASKRVPTRVTFLNYVRIDGMHEPYRRRLPHIMPPGETLFITYRLYNTLPYSVLLDLQSEHASFLTKQKQKNPDLSEKDINQQWEARYFLTIDSFIDKFSEGDNWLCETHVASLVKEAIHYRDGNRFDLHAYCIMPNHVHLLVTNNQQNVPFYRVLGSLKANSAKVINEHLNRVGKPLWASESYDHVVRTGKSFERIISYIVGNPVKAGFVKNWEDWPHSYCKYDWK